VPSPSVRAYAVTVLTQPDGQTCGVANASGTALANVTNVAVTCGFAVGGTVTGLGANNSVMLLNNGGDATTVAANGVFAFAGGLPDGGTYAVTVGTQPVGQHCSVTNGNGTVSATVTDILVTCVDDPSVPVPTLSEWGIMILAALMALGVLPTLRRRRI
jgi:hypothetical protein